MHFFRKHLKLCLCCEVVLGGSLVKQQTQTNLAANPTACNYVNHCLSSIHWSNRCTKESLKQCQQHGTHSSHEECCTEWAKLNQLSSTSWVDLQQKFYFGTKKILNIFVRNSETQPFLNRFGQMRYQSTPCSLESKDMPKTRTYATCQVSDQT